MSNLVYLLTEIIEFCFGGRSKDTIEGDNYGNAHWLKGTIKNKNVYFKKDVIAAVEFLLKNCFFNVGNKVLRQIIGLPMGGDPAPFWANLFLFFFEHKWIKKMRQTNNLIARKFSQTFRFIDDLIAINDDGMFENYHREIYPEELHLKKRKYECVKMYLFGFTNRNS